MRDEDQLIHEGRFLRSTTLTTAIELELQRWARSLRPVPVIWLSAALVLLVVCALWLRGAGFYALSLSQRMGHTDYELLSPAHPVGRAYGWVGSGLILLNLACLGRRWAPRWPLGRMSFWFDVHVLTGLTAALFVAFHSAFQLRSPVAVMTATALAVTCATGVIGHFFRVFAPADGTGCLTRIADLDALLPGVGKGLILGLGSLAPRPLEAGSGLRGVTRALPSWLRQASARRVFVRAACEPWLGYVEPFERSYATPLIRELERLAARQVYGMAARELLRAWRPWHRACALAMVAGVGLHVGVALFYGYAWDFAS